MNTESPYLGRCKHKGCDYALFAMPDQVKVTEDPKDIRGGAGPFRYGNYGVLARCTNNHKWFSLRQIKGTYSKDHKCDARCLNAKGHECTCSCGGINHGRGYAIQTVHEAHNLPPVPVQDDKITDKQRVFLRSLLDERVIPDLTTALGDVVKTGEERRAYASRLLDEGNYTKVQASASIKWLLELPKKGE